MRKFSSADLNFLFCIPRLPLKCGLKGGEGENFDHLTHDRKRRNKNTSWSNI